MITHDNIKIVSLFFGAQFLNFTIITINFIAIAERNYAWTAISDIVYTSISFFIIKKIAESKGKFYEWLGYVSGSVAGSMLGIYLSTHILNR